MEGGWPHEWAKGEEIFKAQGAVLFYPRGLGFRQK
jgi:hypothetical protein